MAIPCSARIRCDGKVKNNSEANSKNGVGGSAEHAKFPRVPMAIPGLGKIRCDDKVDRKYEADPKNGVERSYYVLSLQVYEWPSLAR